MLSMFCTSIYFKSRSTTGKKWHIDTQSAAINYEQKNVGQIFYVHNPATGDFYHLGTSKEILGKQKLKAEFDPIERAISSGGSVLIYVSKSHIYNKSIYSEFDKYIKLCNKLENQMRFR